MEDSGTGPGPTERPDAESSESAEIRAFLIADVRGYTLFTQERGDEAAAKLAAKFARLAREAVDARGGSVIELRGDEALAVFASPRQAIRAAVELQDRFVDETLDDPTLPLTVGIGLDAGEAVPVEGGYRGGALNQAARLCGLAGPGEVLASREITHLARRTDGIDYTDRGDVTVKGLTEPVHVIAVSSSERPAAPRLEPIVAERKASAEAAAAPSPIRRAWVRRHRLLAAGIAVAVAAAAVAVPILLGGGSVALASVPPNSIGRIDPATGHITGTIGLDLTPGTVTAGDGAVWVTNPNDGRITRIDPATKAVSTIAVPGSPSSVAAEGGLVWVTDETGPSVNQISPETNGVVGPPSPVGNGPVAVAVGFGSVWVANRLDGSVTRLDETDGSFQKTILIGATPTAIAISADGVWATDAGSDRVLEISPATNTVEQAVPVGGDPEALAVGPDGVWVANAQNGTVSRIDPANGSVAETIPVGQGPSSIAVTGTTVWVTNRFDGTVSRIDASPGASRQPETIPTESSPVGSAVVGGEVWVSVQGAATSHRGGTLRVVTSSGFEVPYLDPQAYTEQSWQVLIMTNDGLVAFQRVGGGDGTTVVADLATSLPTISSGGTVYSFHVRTGIRYSNGDPVRPSDIKRGIERGYQVPQINGPAGQPAIAGYYDVIVGGVACRQAFEANPDATTTCDLSRGIVTDDRAGTIVFHLTGPDPDFLQKLAMPFAYAIPAGVPMHAAATEPVPATGPYRIASYDAKAGMTLVRNGRFHLWSAAAQPDGFPDEIRYTFGVSPADQVRSVEDGTADWMVDAPPPDALSTLTTRYAGRVHPYPKAATFYVALNTTMRPFDSELARRAVSYAFDRAATLAITGGPQAGRVTCQFLPPNFPGYHPYCPYTADPNPETGAWTDPDLKTAARLVAQSGTKEAAVEVWVAPYTQQYGSYVVDLLDQLGYRATLHGPKGYFAKAYPPAPGVQVAIDGWLQDYPSAQNFLALMQCGSEQSLTRLCDPKVDAAIAKARAAQTSRPELAGALWADVDRLVVDLAAQVDFVNGVGIDFLSSRVGNAQHNPQWGLLLDQVWVR